MGDSKISNLRSHYSNLWLTSCCDLTSGKRSHSRLEKSPILSRKCVKNNPGPPFSSNRYVSWSRSVTIIIVTWGFRFTTIIRISTFLRGNIKLYKPSLAAVSGTGGTSQIQRKKYKQQIVVFCIAYQTFHPQEVVCQNKHLELYREPQIICNCCFHPCIWFLSKSGTSLPKTYLFFL